MRSGARNALIVMLCEPCGEFMTTALESDEEYFRVGASDLCGACRVVICEALKAYAEKLEAEVRGHVVNYH
jgi:tRNA(Ile)-lysidine synthase TilS/MesJ